MTTQPINSVGPDFTIPIPSGAGQPRSVQQQGSQEHPALFGQNQIKGGFGPIYAIPAFPWQPGPGQGQGSGLMQESSSWQNEHSQSQQHGGFGPVYAVPPYPWQNAGGQWQYGYYQSPGSGQWYPWGMQPQVMPWYTCPPAGYQNYR